MLVIVVLLMCFLPTVEGQRCNKSEIIRVGPGEELLTKFSFDDPREEHEKYIPGQYGKKIIQNKIQIQNLTTESQNRFDNMKIVEYYVISVQSGRTEKSLFLTNDTLLIQITELESNSRKYWIELNSNYLRSKDPSKPEDNYKTILQLECNSISTSIGPCQLVNNSMYILWYKNGMRMTDLDPTLSQINVTVDGNLRNFTCLATEYYPCYHRLQTTKHFNDLSVKECDFDPNGETLSLESQHAPIEVKLEPDKREITVNQGEDLKVRCTAKCRRFCDITWKKDFLVLPSYFVWLEDNYFGNDLKIENISSFDEGIYSCLVNNNYGVAEKNFTLRIRELKNKTSINVLVAVKIVLYVVIVGAVVAVIVIFILVLVFAKYRKVKGKRSKVAQESPAEEVETVNEATDSPQRELLPTESRSVIDETGYETMALPQRRAESRSVIDEDNYLTPTRPLHLKIPRNATEETVNEATDSPRRELLSTDSRLIIDDKIYETIDESNARLNRSNEALNKYEKLNRSNVTSDRSYETFDVPFAETSGDYNSQNGGRNQINIIIAT